MNITRRTALLSMAGTSLLGVISSRSWSQDYPAKTITLEVPMAAGGPSDALARFTAHELEKRFKTTVLVENRPGANGVIGVDYVARSTPDGYTLINTGGASFNTALFKENILTFDMFKDFTPVSLTAILPYALIIHADIPAKNLGEFIEYSKSSSEPIRFGSTAATNTLWAQMLASQLGINIIVVSYKGGSEVTLGMLSGEIQATLQAPFSDLPHIHEGTFRALAITAEERFPSLPDVPTAAEAGFPEAIFVSNSGIWAPAGTPGHIVDKLNAAIVDMCNDVEVKKVFLEKFGAVAKSSTPDEFAEFIRRDQDQIMAAAQRFGYKP